MKRIKGTEYIAYIKSQKLFRVSRRINGEYRYLGSHKSLICALMIRDWCRENNWKKFNPYFKYIKKTPCGNYAIYKQCPTEHIQRCFGTFKTLGDAEYELKLLKKYDFDLEVLCDLNE